MEDAFQVHLTIKGEADHILPILTSWGDTQEHPISVGMHNQSGGLLELQLSTPSRYDYREELFNMLASEHIPILEMKKQDQTLEEVFQKLTTTEQEDDTEQSSEEPGKVLKEGRKRK